MGTQNQCVGVAERLGIEPVIKQVALKQPWKTLSPWLGFEKASTFDPPLKPPWPDLVIASGRKSIAAVRYINKQSKGHTFTVQVQDPKVHSKTFDLVAVPYHDSYRGDNVIVTDGAPNRITTEKLEIAKKEFSPLFGDFKRPKVAVLIGGNSKTHTMTAENMTDLAKQLQELDADLMITASRRTGEENIRILRDALAGRQAFMWDGQGENPYFGMLAHADHILVTADSVSMISDAGTTGKPVYMIPMQGRSAKFDKFHQHMRNIGVLRDFDGNLLDWTYEPLNDAAKIANAIKERLGIK